jgi:hypothetical protein
MDAAAVAAYHVEQDVPIVHTLICDDAPQFNWLTGEMMLCWVHEGRPYKKLMPVIPLHQELLEGFLKSFWEYYDQLLAYRQKPTPDERERLAAEFDRLFATRTDVIAALQCLPQALAGDFKDLWEGRDSSDSMRAILRQVAAAQEGFLEDGKLLNPAAPEAELRKTLDFILRRDILIHESGGYRFRAGLLKRWVQGN